MFVEIISQTYLGRQHHLGIIVIVLGVSAIYISQAQLIVYLFPNFTAEFGINHIIKVVHTGNGIHGSAIGIVRISIIEVGTHTQLACFETLFIDGLTDYGILVAYSLRLDISKRLPRLAFRIITMHVTVNISTYQVQNKSLFVLIVPLEIYIQ